MTHEDIMKCDHLSVKALFVRCWKAYEALSKNQVKNWHSNYPEINEMAYWLSRLSADCWTYNHIKDNCMIYYKFEIKFDSLEELELKLAIRGY